MSQAFDIKRLRHDLRDLIEPFETAEFLCRANRPVDALKIQTPAVNALRKLLLELETSKTDQQQPEPLK